MEETSERAEKKATYDHQPRLNDVAQIFLADLKEERERLSDEFPMCALLIAEAFDRIYCTGHIPGKERYADVIKQKPMKITQKVFVPVKQYPKFNFTGKILGVKGNSLRRVQEETQCKIAIKGRNSIRDRAKEEQLRNSEGPQYAHLQKDLFLEVSTVAPPAEGYARIAYALAEIRKYIIPDKNDEVSHEQMRESKGMDPNLKAHRPIFDNKFGGSNNGLMDQWTKFINLIKRDVENTPDADEVEEEEEDEDEQCMPPKLPPPGNEYSKSRPSIIPTNGAAYKRPYPTDKERKREPPMKSHKPTY